MRGGRGGEGGGREGGGGGGGVVRALKIQKKAAMKVDRWMKFTGFSMKKGKLLLKRKYWIVWKCAINLA